MLKINFKPFPILESSRLLLRNLNIDFVNDIYEMRNNPKMIEFTDGKVDENIEDTIKYIESMIKGVDQNKWIIWGIYLKESSKLIGTISIWNFNKEENKAELGYGLNPSFWHYGYMKEALNEALKYGFNILNLSSIEAYTEQNNIASINLLNKSDFKLIGNIEEEGYYKPNTFKMSIYQKQNSNSDLS